MPSEALRVLVTGVGGPAGLAVIRALAGDDVELYAADIDPYAQGLYHVAEQRRLIVPRGDAPDFGLRLRELSVEHGIDLLIPTVEVEMPAIIGERALFRTAGVGVLAPEAGPLAVCLDKWTLMRALAPSPYVPRTELLDSGFDPGGWPDRMLVKPRRGSGSSGIVHVHDPEQLRNLPRDGSNIVQELLPGDEFSVDVLALDHAGAPRRAADGSPSSVAVARERLKIDSGIAVTSRVVIDHELESAAIELVERLDVGPIANVQFKRDSDGNPRLLEINPRVPGTIALSIAAGVNMPLLALEAWRGHPVDLERVSVSPVAMVRALDDRPVSIDEIARMEALARPPREAVQ